MFTPYNRMILGMAPIAMNRPAQEQGLPSPTNMAMPAGLPFSGAMPPTAMGKPMAAFNRMAGPMFPPGLTTGLSGLPPMSLPGMGLGKGGMGMGLGKGGMGRPTMPMPISSAPSLSQPDYSGLRNETMYTPETAPGNAMGAPSLSQPDYSGLRNQTMYTPETAPGNAMGSPSLSQPDYSGLRNQTMYTPETAPGNAMGSMLPSAGGYITGSARPSIPSTSGFSLGTPKGGMGMPMRRPGAFMMR